MSRYRRSSYPVGSRQRLPYYAASGAAMTAAIAESAKYKLMRRMRKKKAVSSHIQSNSNPTKTVKKYRRRYPYRKAMPKTVSLQKQINSLKKTQKNNQGMLTYRWRTTGRILAAVNQQTFSSLVATSVTSLETVLSQLRYYDPAAPGSLVTADGTTGSYQKDFLFTLQSVIGLVRNNYQSPAKVTIYVFQVKDDTSINPPSAFANGLADVSNATETSPLVYVSDSDQLSDLWKIVKTYKCILQPGEEYEVSYSTPKFRYDPSLTDSHPDSYQRRYKAYAIVARVEGVVGHDSSVDEQGMLAAGIDWVVKRTWKVSYDAGGDIDFVYVNDTSDSFTNGGLVSQKPIPDNLGYSVN